MMLLSAFTWLTALFNVISKRKVPEDLHFFVNIINMNLVGMGNSSSHLNQEPSYRFQPPESRSTRGDFLLISV